MRATHMYKIIKLNSCCGRIHLFCYGRLLQKRNHSNMFDLIWFCVCERAYLHWKTERMDWTWFCVCVWSSIFAWALLLVGFSNKKSRGGSKNLPPGPPGWPVIGNMLDLSSKPHQRLADLKNKYGPLIWLRLGSVNTMVVSSADAAMEMFKNNDLSFNGRTITEAMRACSYNEGSMALAQYGPYWRALRRICTAQLLTNTRMKESENVRRKCINNMHTWISDEMEEKGSVEIARHVSYMSFNLIANLMLSQDLVDPQSKQGDEFFTSVSRFVQWGGKPNVADFFPLLKRLDPQGIKKKMERDLGLALRFASKFVKERIQQRKSDQDEHRKKDFLDLLLEFQGDQKAGEPAKIMEKDVNVLILELFTASTDTVTSTLEWAMIELLCNARVLSEVQAELNRVVGEKTSIEEEDIEGLPYLQAVVKETLRLHPPVPLLVPHKAIDNIEFMGYSIPKGTQIFVNVWAIGRDPTTWDDPLYFKPERFMNSSVDYKGQHFQLIPFGAGRRICVGLPLAHRVLHLTLASLLHSFEWTLESGMTPEKMDMKERMGITLRKADPLKAVAKSRHIDQETKGAT
ncbi:hypothetical protein Sjap_001276 [Stephania japonica]|uniref:Cytochrome P450 n=1 Tax=Stephania japonica TaxID=461633 RepID=A0AAP0KJQ0_9MAGN